MQEIPIKIRQKFLDNFKEVEKSEELGYKVDEVFSIGERFVFRSKIIYFNIIDEKTINIMLNDGSAINAIYTDQLWNDLMFGVQINPEKKKNDGQMSFG